MKPSLGAIPRLIAHHPIWTCLAVGALFAPALYLALQLSVKSDFKRLLPQQKKSVIALNQFVKQVGGLGSLIVGVECDDMEATKRFIDDLVPKVESLPKNLIRYVEYNVKDVKQFFEDNKYLYVDLPDLIEIDRRLRAKIEYEKLKANPFFFDLEEREVTFDIQDIEDKYRKKTSTTDKYIDGYYFHEDKTLAAVIIKPAGTSTGVGFSKRLMATIDGLVAELDPKKYHPSLKIHYTGKYKATVKEYHALIQNVLSTLALCFFLVGFSIFLYFMRLRVVFLLATALVVGSTWAFGLTKLFIGYLNSQTAFLGSIIVGNGVNYGIILIARYLEERRKEIDIQEAVQIAMQQTWAATLTAAVTTSAGFAALGISKIKGFSQFGFIGGVGMVLCWLASYTFLPAILVLTEKVVPMSPREGLRTKIAGWKFALAPWAKLVTKRTQGILVGGTLLAAVCFGSVIHFIPDSLEYDFRKLRNIPKKVEKNKIGKRVDEIFGQNTSPTVVLLNKTADAQSINPRAVCDSIMRQEENLRDSDKTIESCKSIYEYIPEEQPEKMGVLAKIRKQLEDDTLEFIKKPEHKEEIANFKASVDLDRIAQTDLPPLIQRNFEELDGSIGNMVYVYPMNNASLARGRKLMQFSEVLEKTRDQFNDKITVAGSALIFSDLLRAVERDGPKASLASLLTVTLLVLLTFRRLRSCAYVIGGLLLGVLFMIGIQGMIPIRYNFFNFIALPVTFGIGVDYGVNLYQRYRLEGAGSVGRVLETTGGAVLLCSITTIVAYCTLTNATSQALASFGWLALIGELSCLAAGMLVMPAMLLRFFDRD